MAERAPRQCKVARKKKGSAKPARKPRHVRAKAKVAHARPRKGKSKLKHPRHPGGKKIPAKASAKDQTHKHSPACGGKRVVVKKAPLLKKAA